jgi:peptide deformylase
MKIVHYPHPALRVKARPVTTIDADLHRLIGRMLELMYEQHGLGLAGPQVASDLQVLVLNFAGEPEQKDMEHVAINPVLIESSGSQEDREGCLSFPDLYQKVRRAKQVKVQAYNLQGELYEMTCVDLAARLWQHEIDHLNGVLFIDKMGPFGRMASRGALKDFEAEFERLKRRGELPADLAPKF